MTDVAQRTSPEREWLDPRASERLLRHIDRALARARSGGAPVLVSVTSDVDADTDPTAVVAASRRPGEPWFCLEQPDRDGSALAAVGSVRALEASGPDRFKQTAKRWRGLAAAAIADDADGPPGSGLVALGGFAFAADGASSPHWAGFEPASMVVPEVTLARKAGRVSLTLNLDVAPDDTRDDLLGRARRRLGELRRAPLPLLDPDPAGDFAVVSPMPPAHYEEAVASAVRRIRAGELQKIVLAREVEVRAPAAHDPAAILAVLREAFSSSYVFAVGRGDATFMAATPELLVRREGQRASTVALAGSIGRSADPAVDDHLGEQLLGSDKDREENAIVVRRIVRALAPHSVWVTAAPDPVVVRVANIQHLATPIRAQLTSPIGAIELAGVLHPTPAVGARARRARMDVDPGARGP